MQEYSKSFERWDKNEALCYQINWIACDVVMLNRFSQSPGF